MNKNSTWLFPLILFSFYSCESWELNEEVFLQIKMETPTELSIDSVSVAAELKDFTAGQIQSHGFVFTTSDQNPTITLQEGVIDLGLKTNSDSPGFEAAMQLETNTEYLIRAFASLDGEDYVYSETFTYKSGNAMVFTEGVIYEGGLSLRATGRLKGMDKGFVALEHGFCWSTTTSMPSRDDIVVNLGERRNNDPFTGEVSELINNQVHYVRAYAIVIKDSELEVIYGEVSEFSGDLEFWTQKANLPFGTQFAVGFSIGDRGYIGTGYLGDVFETDAFWEYNPVDDTWSQKASFPGGDRDLCVGLSIGDKGYVGLGRSGLGGDYHSDFWEYDPLFNSWERKADFGGVPRSSAKSFTVNGIGYVGLGIDGSNALSDFWAYNPESDSWTQVSDYAGGKRINAFSFAINDKGFVGTGQAGYFDDELSDFWEYDPQSDTWTQKADFGAGVWADGSGFALNDLGYVVCGGSLIVGQCKQSLWSYNPSTDTWSKQWDFQGSARGDAVSFSIGNKGYCGTSTCQEEPMGDFWEYDPIGL